MMTTAKRIAFAALVLMGSVVSAQAQSYTLAPLPYQWVLTTGNEGVPNGCVWTYQAGTTTAIATYSDNAGTPNGNPIIADNYGRFVVYLLAGTSYKFVYESTPCSAPATHGTVLKTQDNIAATPASAASVDITGTAGESLAAGTCAYLSDGSGSKNAGQWYKCDSANTYSSTTIEVGVPTAAITIATTGTIRLVGQVTTAAALSTGSEYYVGTAGALTATAPANTRHLGHADSSTTLILTGNPPTPPIATIVNDFRLTLTTGTCVTTSDVTGASATTLYLTPCEGNKLTLFSSAGVPETCTTAQVSIAVPATTVTMYDVWAYDSTFGTCTVTLELLAWTNDTTRATAIARTTVGAYTKSGDLTRLYLGSFRTAGVSGQTENSIAKRYVWNYYNRKLADMRVLETTDTWAYTTNTWRQANAATANQLEFVIGVNEDIVQGEVKAYFTGGAGTMTAVAIGEDSTSAVTAGNIIVPAITNNDGASVHAALKRVPAVGRHVWVWLEKGNATSVATWQGDNGGTGFVQSGIHGSILN